MIAVPFALETTTRKRLIPPVRHNNPSPSGKPTFGELPWMSSVAFPLGNWLAWNVRSSAPTLGDPKPATSAPAPVELLQPDWTPPLPQGQALALPKQKAVPTLAPGLPRTTATALRHCGGSAQIATTSRTPSPVMS